MSIPPVATYDPLRGVGYINNQAVSRYRFTTMLHSLKKEVEEAHQGLLLGFGPELARLWQRPDTLEERVGTHAAGYGYLVWNPFFTQFKEALSHHIAKDARLSAEFLLPFASGDVIQWNRSAVYQWLSRVDQYVLQMACLFYFLAGQPPRMPELLSMRLYEGSRGQRNLYLMENELVWFVKYTKSENMTGIPLPVLRVTPRFLRDLVEQYVAVLRPLQVSFYTLLGCPIGDHDQFLFLHRGKAMSSEVFSGGLRALSDTGVSQKWGVRAWRQYIIVLTHNILPRSVLEAPLILTAVVAQASHRAATGQQSYNQQVGTTLPTVNSGQFRQFFTASLALQEALGFPHPVLSHPDSKETPIDHEYIASSISARVIQQCIPQITEGVRESLVQQEVARAVLHQQTRNLSVDLCRFV